MARPFFGGLGRFLSQKKKKKEMILARWLSPFPKGCPSGSVFGLWAVGLIHGAFCFFFGGFQLAKNALAKARNMSGFFRSQSLVLLEVLDTLELDDAAELCERIHDLAEEISRLLPEDEQAAD
ncbi:Rop family plasmid primer RNA-binding protein [Enterobacter cloacae]|uniref:Rop family plasmid primer RNA-binding protein n=2 Tax=Enterobacter cloacae TaxID=550 RepID=UPI003C701067